MAIDCEQNDLGLIEVQPNKVNINLVLYLYVEALKD